MAVDVRSSKLYTRSSGTSLQYISLQRRRLTVTSQPCVSVLSVLKTSAVQNAREGMYGCDNAALRDSHVISTAGSSASCLFFYNEFTIGCLCISVCELNVWHTCQWKAGTLQLSPASSTLSSLVFVFGYFQLLAELLSPSLIYPQHCYLSLLLRICLLILMNSITSFQRKLLWGWLSLPEVSTNCEY